MSLFLIYIIFGFFGIPYGIKNILPNKIMQNSHLKMKVEKVYFNPFSFYLELNDINFTDKENKTLFKAKHIDTKLNFFTLFSKTISLKSLNLDTPSLFAVIDKKGRLNLLLGEQNSTKSDDETTLDWDFELGSIDIKNADINFKGQNLQKPIDISLKPLNFKADNLSTKRGVKSSQNMDTQSSKSKNVDYKGTMSLNPFSMQGELKVSDLDIDSFVGYGLGFKDIYPKDAKVNLSFKYALFASKQHIKLGFDDINMEFLGLKIFNNKDKLAELKKLEFKDFKCGLDTNKSVFKIEKGKLKSSDIKLTKNSFFPLLGELKSIGVDGVNVRYDFDGRLKAKVPAVSLSGSKLSVDKNRVDFNSAKFSSLEFGLYKKDFEFTLKKAQLLKPTVTSDKVDKISFSKAQMQNLKLDKKSLLIDKVGVDGGDIKYTLKDTPRSEQNPQQSAKKDSNFAFIIKDFELSNTKLDFTHEKKFQQKVSSISLRASDITNDSTKSIKFSLDAKNGSELALKVDGDAKPSPLKISGDYTLSYTSLGKLDGYLKEFSALKLSKGKVSSKGKITYSDDKLKLKSNISLHELSLLDKSKKKFFELKALMVNSLSLNGDNIAINSISVTKPRFNLLIKDDKSTNLDNIMINNAKKKGKSRLNFYLKKLVVKDGEFLMKNNDLLTPSTLEISAINAQLDYFYLNKKKSAKLKLNANLNKTGYLSASGSFVPKDIKINTNINTNIKNLDIKTINSYTQKYLGYNTKKGTISTSVIQDIKKGKLKGSSDTLIEGFKLGSTVKSKDAISVPLETGLMLLSDSNGDVRLNIPMSGDMNSPDFSYGGIVLSAIMKFFTGVVTAPFGLLGDMLGIDANKLKNIDFQPSSDELVVSELEKMDYLKKLIDKKPKLKLVIQGAYDKELDSKQTKEEDLKALASKRAENIKMELIKKGISEKNIEIGKIVSIKSNHGEWIGCKLGIK